VGIGGVLSHSRAKPSPRKFFAIASRAARDFRRAGSAAFSLSHDFIRLSYSPHSTPSQNGF
ncbi:MAG: hypothetical protein MPK13_06005, partial [Gammaproteobacteria bacterium]|nr:hypothetical protein [Gammaproteobacteria bacterium]